MALTLGTTLSNAQNSQSRHPIVDIVCTQATDYIPFDGVVLYNTDEHDENPNMIMMDTGRIAVVFTVGSTDIYLAITDIQRLEYTFTSILTAGEDSTFDDACLVELSDGTIGIVYQETEESVNQYIKYMIINTDGNIISSGTIVTYPVSQNVLDPWITWLPETEVFMMVYVLHIPSVSYSIHKITSADFSSWSSDSTLSISGTSSSRNHGHPTLLEISISEIFLWFDYVTDIVNGNNVYNVCYSVSTDGGSTWGTMVQLTEYDDVIAYGYHPVALSKDTGRQSMVYTENRSVLMKDSSGCYFTEYEDADWVGSNSGDPISYNLSWDAINRKLYVCDYKTGVLESITRIDVDNWEVDQNVNDSSVPALPTYMTDLSVFFKYTGSMLKGEGQYIPFGHYNSGANYHVVLHLWDGENEITRTYCFVGYSYYSIEENVSPTPYGTGTQLQCVQVDIDSMRMYCLFMTNQEYNRTLDRGYIDLTEEEPYTWHSIRNDTSLYTQREQNPFSVCPSILVIPEYNYVVFSGGEISHGSGYDDYVGPFEVIDLETGGFVYNIIYDPISSPDFPMHGLKYITYSDNRIYGAFQYESLFGEEDKRGLCSFDLRNGSINYHRPDFAELDEYEIRRVTTLEDGHIACATWGYGLLIYDPVNDSWIQHSSDTIEGFLPDDGSRSFDQFGFIEYDQSTGLVFMSAQQTFWTGITAVNRYGLIHRLKIINGVDDSGWIWDPATLFVSGYSDKEATICLHPTDDTFYSVWTNKNIFDLRLKWDAEGDLPITPYLIGEIEIERNIDGAPARLYFRLGRGHLFDPNNSYSLLSIYLTKGNELECLFGEEVDGVNYWQTQGKFYVTEFNVTYETGEYPVASVVAEDFRTFWLDAKVLTSPAFSEEMADEALFDIMFLHSGLAGEKIDIPQFVERVGIDAQWVDTPLTEIIEDIANRFFYFPRIDVDGNFTLRRIASSLPVDNSYTDNTKIINFTPDDSFSDFVNRITVRGEERTFTQVIYMEERVDSLSGTVGWWDCKKHYVRYYSPDKTKRVLNPRLVVIESVQSLGMTLGGGVREFLTVQGETACVVSVDVPNLSTVLSLSIANMMGSFAVPDGVVAAGFIGNAGTTIPIGAIVQGLSLFWLMTMFSAIANFQYEIYGYPVGYIRNKVAATENDLELQEKIGCIVSEELTDVMVYNYSQAEYVARKEMEIRQLQRNRVRFQKVANLQDEEGDTIEIIHPYTEQTIKIYVTKITRNFPIITNPSHSEDQGFIDTIEGWVIS